MSFTLNEGQLDAITRIVQENYYKNSVLGQTIINASNMVAPGMKQITMPTISQAQVQDKVSGVDLTDSTFTMDGDVLVLDKDKAIYSTIEDRSELQSMPNLGSTLVREFAKAWVDQLEQDVGDTVIKGCSQGVQLDDGTGTEITQDAILEARKLLNDAKLPFSDRFLAVSTAQEKAMLAIPEFVRADAIGSPEGLRNGIIGRVYGMDVVLTHAFSDAQACVYHREHCAWASQRTPRFERDRIVRGLKDEYALSLLYGLKALRGGIYGVAITTDGSVPV